MPRPKVESKKFIGLINTTVWEKLQQIKEEIGLPYDVRAIEFCIIKTYEEYNKPYMQALKNRAPKEKLDPEEKAKRYLEDQDARREAIKNETIARGNEIAQQLDGTIIDHGNGFYSVQYKTYDLSTPNYVSVGTLTVPFEQLDETNVVNQYRTSLPNITNVKERILEVLQTQNQDE